MRLFIAINFSDKTRVALKTLRDDLQSRSESGRFVETENLHLTLVFLGECNNQQIASIKSVMNGIEFAPFKITIDRLGRFKRYGSDLWWVGLQESKPLQRLHNDLNDKLISADFILEKRKYSPHITLGREVKTSVEPHQIPAINETVISIELMKSERVNGKMRYTAIYQKIGSNNDDQT